MISYLAANFDHILQLTGIIFLVYALFTVKDRKYSLLVRVCLGVSTAVIMAPAFLFPKTLFSFWMAYIFYNYWLCYTLVHLRLLLIFFQQRNKQCTES